MNEELYRGVTYDPDSRAIMNGIASVHQQVLSTEQTVVGEMSKIEQNLRNMCTKPRRSLVSTQVVTMRDGRICVAKQFSDESCEMLPFITNFAGSWKVCRLKLEDDDVDARFFAISFRGAMYAILGEIAGITATKLYRLFVENGVVFSSYLKEATVKRLLFETFAPMIKTSEEILTIPQRAGWYNDRFMTRERFPLYRERFFAQLPLSKSSLPETEYSKEMMEMVFEELRGIPIDDRLMMFLFPFVSLMGEIFGERNRIFLNLVPLGDFDISAISALLQVFNKSCNQVTAIDSGESKVMEKLHNAGDETLILDGCVGNDATLYYRRKVIQIQDKIGAICLGQACISGYSTPLRCSVVVIADELCRRNNSYNMMIPEGFCTKNPIDLVRRGFSQTFYGFVKFVEERQEQIGDESKCAFTKVSSLLIPYVNALWVLEKFYRSLGFDFYKELQIDLTKSLRCMERKIKKTEQDVEEMFIMAFRNSAKQYCFRERGAGTFCKNCIWFDEENIWVTAEQFTHILKENRIQTIYKEVLVKARNSGNLKTDASGMTRKMQVNGIRREFYQFRRKMFNKTGCTDIVELGGEDNER